jgi:DNA polymerase-3 subunit alpha
MDGISRPEDMVIAAKERGLKSIALTDHGHMHGTADFYLHGKKHGVKTIYGVEAYAIDSLSQWAKDKAALESDKESFKKLKKEQAIDEDATNLNLKDRTKSLYRKGHLVLLAQNQKGLENLYSLTHLSYKNGLYMKPRMDKEMLNEFSEGVVASSACMGGVVANRCWAYKNGHGTWAEVVREAEEYKEIFGDRFFLELQFNESDSQRFINDCIVKVHKETGIPLDVTADAHYINSDEWSAQEILYMLRSGTSVATRSDDWDFNIKQLYIKSPQEMWDAVLKYGGDIDHNLVRQAFDNTLLIDSMISDYEPDTVERLPTCRFEHPFQELGQASIARMKELNLDQDENYRKRFMHEMKLIKEKGFASYFLIMRDIITKAKEQMLVGPGRGSAAGSLVCYLTGLTDLDPIKHGLLFERFINPSRVELPDIDTDFQDSDRAREMLRDMFGEDNVACISTYGTFQIKGLLKDVARVYDIDHREINKANKKIQAELRVLHGKGQDKSTIDIKYDDVTRVSPTFRALLDKYPVIGDAIPKLYGRNRHVGRHACGLVIGDDLPREMAVFKNKGILQTSFTDGIVNKQCSAMGFVKFDILSLSTLSVIDESLKLISERHDMAYDEAYHMIDPTYMDIDDPTVIKKVFIENNYTGIFQFTGKGIRKVAMRIGPDCFNDVSAIGAIYRPGPLGSGMHKLYAENKHNPEGIKYVHPIMEEIMGETYGCLVYQEQMLNIGNKLGKLPMTHVNRLRKLFLKKDKSKKDDFLVKEKKELNEVFVKGCVENGLEKKQGQELWDMFEHFGGYGFNASHAKCYAMITMQTAFLRTYYPLEFFTALLIHGKADDLQTYVDDIKRQGFTVLPVDINKSQANHAIEDEKIRLAFGAVLGVGAAAVKKIVKSQPYDNFRDYLYRTGGGKTATLPLVKVGAFTSFEENVALTEAQFELWQDQPKLRTKKKRPEFEELYFALDIEPHHLAKGVEYENELLGFNLRGSPFKLFDRDTKIEQLHSEGLIMDYSEFLESDKTEAVVPVLVKDIREHAQRNGGMMAFVKFGDRYGTEFDSVCFATIWRYLINKTKKGNVYLCHFNRKLDEPRNLVMGKPGWAQSAYSAQEALTNLDELE